MRWGPGMHHNNITNCMRHEVLDGTRAPPYSIQSYKMRRCMQQTQLALVKVKSLFFLIESVAVSYLHSSASGLSSQYSSRGSVYTTSSSFCGCFCSCCQSAQGIYWTMSNTMNDDLRLTALWFVGCFSSADQGRAHLCISILVLVVLSHRFHSLLQRQIVWQEIQH